jgi:putative hemolysin
VNGLNWVELVVVLVCLVLAGFASAAETSLTALGRIAARALEDRNTAAGRAVAYLRHDPSLFLSTILVINSVALIVASSVGTLLLVSLFGGPWGEVAATVGLSVLVLIFVELAPKNVAVRRPQPVALALAVPIRFASILLRPVIVVLGVIVAGIMKSIGQGGYNRPAPLITEEQLREIVSVSEAEGVLEEEEHDMIRGIFQFGVTTVGEVKVPRVDMVALPVDTPLMEALDVILQKGHSRIPIYGESIDDILGVLYDKDVLKYVRSNQLNVDLRAVVRPAFHVPESKRVDELFRELQRKKVHIAIVVDEYGGTDGLVTLEDLLEEIVGEIQDETDKEEPLLAKVGEGTYEVSAMIDIEQLNEELQVQLEVNGMETLGGFVYEQLGEVPTVGAVVNTNQVCIKVVEVEGQRIRRVLVTVRQPDSASEQTDDEPGPADPSSRLDL